MGSDATCAITGTPPTETLNCGPVDLATGEPSTAHVTSGTTVDSCGTYDNTATFTTTNDGIDEASDSTEVLCSDVTITKTADNAKVNAGEDIGFTVTVTNGGTGLAKGVETDDPLLGRGHRGGSSWTSRAATPSRDHRHASARDPGTWSADLAHR